MRARYDRITTTIEREWLADHRGDKENRVSADQTIRT
jgi:hypothetical protein